MTRTSPASLWTCLRRAWLEAAAAPPRDPGPPPEAPAPSRPTPRCLSPLLAPWLH